MSAAGITVVPSVGKLSDEDIAKAMTSNPTWAQRLGWDRYVGAIGVLVGAPNLQPGDAAFAQGVAGWQLGQNLHVDGIVGPKTWAVLKLALSPATSLTGIVPAGTPPVPNGIAEVFATYGDPRPLLDANGQMAAENDNLWQRQTLSRGDLPFAIPLDANKPAAGSKTTFYAHRKLVPVFEAVFEEIARLGMQQRVHSWGGIYNFRPIRGTSSTLSLHGFGAAIDINSETNKLGSEGDMDPGIVDVFEHFGFFWGGKFSGRTDPMHFQYATGC